MDDFKNGALPDARPEEERAKDFQFEEMVASVSPVNWTEKPPISWRKFPIFAQNGSGSCVAQTLAKLLGILYWLKNGGEYVHFSATHLYQRRANRPAAGMAGVDAFKIAQQGTTLEQLVPSQMMTDEQMDSMTIAQFKQDVGTVFKIPNYIQVPVKDIDTIASIIQTTKKGVMVWFYFQINEWGNVPQILNPNLDLQAPSTLRHSVAAVDFTLYQNKKALIIEDSWGPGAGMGGQRIITEDFFKVRNWFAAYPIAFVFDGGNLKPTHTFNVNLAFGQTSDEVRALQDCLKWEGLFPSNISSSGFYGSITAKAVLDFQIKYGISPTSANNVGPMTRQKLNLIFS